MDAAQPGKVLNTSHDRVPEELLQQLHHANERFHESREERERVESDMEDRHQERVDIAADHVREAEREVEEVTARIKKVLDASNKDAPASTD